MPTYKKTPLLLGESFTSQLDRCGFVYDKTLSCPQYGDQPAKPYNIEDVKSGYFDESPHFEDHGGQNCEKHTDPNGYVQEYRLWIGWVTHQHAAINKE